LRQLADARDIRDRLIECFERASSPGVLSEQERKDLLSFVVVGGGPTNVEFASALYDFVTEDVSRSYPDLLPLVQVTLVEASGHILGSFHQSLYHYVETLFRRRHVVMLTDTQVREVRRGVAVLGSGAEL
jgi:NADH dehydrogenase FAD-containing subunit